MFHAAAVRSIHIFCVLNFCHHCCCAVTALHIWNHIFRRLHAHPSPQFHFFLAKGWQLYIMRLSVMWKDCCANFNIKVTMKVYMVEIWLFLVFLLNCWSFSNQTWLVVHHHKLESHVRKFGCSYGPFTCISFHKFSRQCSVFSLWSPHLISALLALSTIYLFLTVSLNGCGTFYSLFNE